MVEMEYQNRNCTTTPAVGHHIVQQFVHSLDKAMWLMGATPTLLRSGGAEVRVQPGTAISTTLANCFEWETESRCMLTRQMVTATPREDYATHERACAVW